MNLGKNNHRRENFRDLPAEIRETELQLLDRQHQVHVHTHTLVRNLKKELASPAALLLAGELGFILGELTRSPPKKQEKKPPVSEGRNTVRKGSGSPSYSLTAWAPPRAPGSP